MPKNIFYNNFLQVTGLQNHVPFTIVFWDDTFDEALNDSTSDVHHTMTDSIFSKVTELKPVKLTEI